MCTINLYEIMRDKEYPVSGDLLFQELERNIASEKIILDMNGVISLPSMFLNMSIFKYIQKYGCQSLRSKISFANISSAEANRINNYINRFCK